MWFIILLPPKLTQPNDVACGKDRSHLEGQRRFGIEFGWHADIGQKKLTHFLFNAWSA
jgi:hypothetical protein